MKKYSWRLVLEKVGMWSPNEPKGWGMHMMELEFVPNLSDFIHLYIKCQKLWRNGPNKMQFFTNHFIILGYFSIFHILPVEMAKSEIQNMVFKVIKKSGVTKIYSHSPTENLGPTVSAHVMESQRFLIGGGAGCE